MTSLGEFLSSININSNYYDTLTSGRQENKPGVKYIIINKKNTILYVGESRILGECHNRSLDAMHAEEDAIRKCWKMNIDIKNIRIVIWKENTFGVKPAFSCNWCRKFILKNNIPIKKCLTPEFTNDKYTGNLTSSVIDGNIPVVMCHAVKNT